MMGAVMEKCRTEAVKQSPTFSHGTEQTYKMRVQAKVHG